MRTNTAMTTTIRKQTKQSKHHRDRKDYSLLTGESFEAVYTINRSEIRTFFTLREICAHSLERTIFFYAGCYGIKHNDFICRVNGIRDCHQQAHNEHWIRRGGWIQYMQVRGKLIVKSDKL